MMPSRTPAALRRTFGQSAVMRRSRAAMRACVTTEPLRSFAWPICCHQTRHFDFHHRAFRSSLSRFEKSKTAETDEDRKSAPPPPTPTQYWRSERIVKAIIQQEKSKQQQSQSPSKPSEPKTALYLRVYKSGKKFTLKVARGSWDLALHPSKFPLLLRRLWASIVHEAKHYWSGTKLLAADVRTAYGLVRKTTKGHTLTRRERRQLQRTTTDLMRLVPFSVFVVVPFMELLLPVALKVFPSMLPSTYQSDSSREQQLKRELNVRLNLAGFLQDTIESLAKQQIKTEDSSVKQSAETLLALLKSVRTGHRINTEELVTVAKFFDTITLDSFTHQQLVTICKYMNLPSLGNDSMLRYAIHVKMQRIHRDDEMIAIEGIDSLTDEELRSACRARGMRDFGLTRDGYARNLQQWLDLSLDKKIPDSLLLLSRALSISEQPSADDIANALKSLSDQSVDEWTEAAGITDNEQRLAIIRRQNELIAEEEKQNKEENVKTAKEKPVTEAVAKSKNESEEEDLDELSALVEKLLTMTKPSAVHRERERLQSMLEKASKSELSDKSRQLIDRMRPVIRAVKEEKDVEHPIQTLNDLARWHVGRVSEAKDLQLNEPIEYERVKDVERLMKAAESHRSETNMRTATKVTMSEHEKSVTEQDAKEAEEEKQRESERDAEYRSKVQSRLNSMFESLRGRIADIDQEIGDKLHLLHTDALGRINDSELIEALNQVHSADSTMNERLITRIKQLAKQRRRAESRRHGSDSAEVKTIPVIGASDWQLNIEDIQSLAKMIEAEKVRAEEPSGHEPDSNSDSDATTVDSAQLSSKGTARTAATSNSAGARSSQ